MWMKNLYLIILITTIINLHAADPEQKLITLIQKVMSGDIEDCIRKRLNANDVNTHFNGQGLLHFAAAHGAVDVMGMLCNKGADVNLCNIINDTPLHYAAKAGHSEAVTFLLEHGAHTNVLDFQRKTPAQLARTEGHDEILQLIDDYEAIPEIKKPDMEF